MINNQKMGAYVSASWTGNTETHQKSQPIHL